VQKTLLLAYVSISNHGEEQFDIEKYYINQFVIYFKSAATFYFENHLQYDCAGEVSKPILNVHMDFNISSKYIFRIM
jgi:hypothetical protein